MISAAGTQSINGTPAVIRSRAMQRLMATVERIATYEAAVLIDGETGSGKELVARAVHRWSPRRDNPFVDVNCAALPEHLVESELFGYEKGAFSGADANKPGLFDLAHGGTIFLDEVGELDIRVQAKLLRVLDGAGYYRLGGSRKIDVDVRVIAATNRDLEQDVKAGKFRGDLYHRLAEFHLRVPPLRDRVEDVSALAEHFLRKHCPDAQFTPDAMNAFERYSWPGNVRELKNVIFKITVNAPKERRQFRALDLPATICGVPEISADVKAEEANLQEMEKRMILRALEQSGNSQKQAALMLGISARTLRRKLQNYRAAEPPRDTRIGRRLGKQQRYIRITAEIPVSVRDGEEVTQVIEAMIANISSGGMAIKSPIPLKHGSTFEVSFQLPGNPLILELKATLAWTSPDGLAGLTFVDIHPAIEKELQQWLLTRASSGSGTGVGQSS
jgi:two-component system, NtrC family, response regulator AtoC